MSRAAGCIGVTGVTSRGALGLVVLATLLIVLACASSAAAQQPDPAPTTPPVAPDPAPGAAPTAPKQTAPVQPVAPPSGEQPAPNPNDAPATSNPAPSTPAGAGSRTRERAAKARARHAAQARARRRADRRHHQRIVAAAARRQAAAAKEFAPAQLASSARARTARPEHQVGGRNAIGDPPRRSGRPLGARAGERLAAHRGDTGDEGAGPVRRVGRRLVVVLAVVGVSGCVLAGSGGRPIRHRLL